MRRLKKSASTQPAQADCTNCTKSTFTCPRCGGSACKAHLAPKAHNCQFRKISRFKFSGHDPASKDTYLSRFSFVWNEAGLNNFEKSFRVLRRCYREPLGDREPVMTHIDHIIWLDLCGHAWDGTLFTKEAMAAKYGMHYGTLTQHIDHLEDIKLLYRVRLTDIHGRPIQHVMMTPLTEEKYKGGAGLKLYAQLGKTKERRDLLGHNNFPERTLEVNALHKAMGDAETAQMLEDIVADIVFKGRPNILTRPTFFDQLNRVCMSRNIILDERLYALAYQRKQLYSNEK